MVWYRALLLTICFVVTVGCVLVLSMCCCYCCFKNHCVDKDHHQKNHKFDTSHFYPQFTQKSLITPESRHCFIVCVCLVFAFPSDGVVCKAFVCSFLMYLYACVGCALFVCLKVNWSASQLSKCNLCFAFWRLFWCSSQVLPCFNVPALMHMLPFVFPYILPCPVAFLVLCICSAS